MNYVWKSTVSMFLLVSSVAFANDEYVSCQKNSKLLQRASTLLEKLEREDQTDRKSNLPWNKIAKRDRERRTEVARLFAHGCMSTARDYSNAALIFQHGDVDFPEHFFQAFLFAKKAVELGATIEKDMMANGIDRYLVKSGRKQLFGSQGSAPGQGVCYCLDQYERSFPENLRVEYKGKTIEQELDWLDQVNKAQGLNCPHATECVQTLAPSPKGTVPGFW